METIVTQKILKIKTAIFKSLQFEEQFQKAWFLWWISVDGRLISRSKALLEVATSSSPFCK